jgi:hypothetical protein
MGYFDSCTPSVRAAITGRLRDEIGRLTLP